MGRGAGIGATLRRQYDNRNNGLACTQAPLPPPPHTPPRLQGLGSGATPDPTPPPHGRQPHLTVTISTPLSAPVTSSATKRLVMTL